jgi:hypothetical protein
MKDVRASDLVGVGRLQILELEEDPVVGWDQRRAQHRPKPGECLLWVESGR